MTEQENKTIDKREQILDVAEDLFSLHGFEAVSVREISKAADINIAMISYYFGSKEKLYEEVVIRKLTTSDKIIDVISKQEKYADKLYAIIDLYIDRFFANRKLNNIIFREMALGQRTEMTELITERLFQNFQIISEVIKKGIKSGEFNKVDVELTATTIIGTIKLYTTSTPIVCRILKINESDMSYTNKMKKRLSAYFRELFSNYLEIK